MLGFGALMFIIIISIRLSLAVNRHNAAMLTHGVSFAGIRLLQMSALLYIPSVLAVLFPGAWLALPFWLLLLAPGIGLGYKYGKMLERSGTDVGAAAGRAASNIMWLGIGVVVFIAGNFSFLLLAPGANYLQ